MDPFENARKALGELESHVKSLDALILQKRRDFSGWERKIEEEKTLCDRIIFEKGKLEEILNQCSTEVCQYKNEFEVIRERYSGEVESKVANQKFHFFLCYRGDYYGKDKEGVIQSHGEIVNKNGFCWWGKFANKRQSGGKYRSLEPFGESMRPDDGAGAAFRIREKVLERIAKGEPVFLYNYSPNPPDIHLYVCNVTDCFFGKETIPYENRDDRVPPECAYIPEYYFHQREGNCSSCKAIDRKKCQLQFQCNFWFKIDRIRELEDVPGEFVNLMNCFTQDSINLAIPILYPLLVRQRTKKDHFPELVKPIVCDSGFTLEIPRKERGHTKTMEVQGFFSDLNRSCGECFVKVESIGCERPFSGEVRQQKSEGLDEISLVLPARFRGDGKACSYKITLHKQTSAEQKQKVEKMIKDFLKLSF